MIPWRKLILLLTKRAPEVVPLEDETANNIKDEHKKDADTERTT